MLLLQDGSHSGWGVTGVWDHLASLQVASLWPLPGGEGNAWWNRNLKRRTISSVPATTPWGPELLLTREMEEKWEARGETERPFLAIVTLPHSFLVTLQQLSSPGQRAKIGLAHPVSPPQSYTTLCAVRDGGWHWGRKSMVYYREGASQRLGGWSPCTCANACSLIWDELLLWYWKANHPVSKAE